MTSMSVRLTKSTFHFGLVVTHMLAQIISHDANCNVLCFRTKASQLDGLPQGWHLSVN